MWNAFGWIRRKRLARRGMVRYWDGTGFRFGDPFLLWRRLKHHETVDIEGHWTAAENGDEPETTELVCAIAETFEVRRWDGQSGMTDWEIMDLLQELVAYLDGVKKKHSPSPTSSPPTDSESSTSPAPPSEPVNSGSDSG